MTASELERLVADFRSQALNDRHGTPNTPSSGYHETITVTYARLIELYLATFESHVAIERRVTDLLAGPVAAPGFLLRFWSRDRLMSPTARAAWLEPDLAPLALPPGSSPA